MDGQPVSRPSSARKKLPDAQAGSVCSPSGKLKDPVSPGKGEEDISPKSGVGKLLPMDRSRLAYGGREVSASKPTSPTTLPLIQKKIIPPARNMKYENATPTSPSLPSTSTSPRRPLQSSPASPTPSSPGSATKKAVGSVPRNVKMSLVKALQSQTAPKQQTALQARLRDQSEHGSKCVDMDDAASMVSSTPRSTTSTISHSSVGSEKWTSRGYSQSTGSTSSRRSSSNPPIDGEKQKRKRSSRSLHIGFDNCSIDLECEHKEHPGSLVIKHWNDLFKDHPDLDNIVLCLKAYGMETPTKLQGHAIAAILRGVQPNTRSKSGKSCVMIQGPSGIGKTSAVALAVTAIVDPSVKHIQALVLCGSTLRDFDKFHTVFTTLQRGNNYASLFEGSTSTSSTHPDYVVPTRHGVESGTQVVCGRPRSMLHLLGHSPLCLDHIRILIIDDAQELAGFKTDTPLTTTPLDDVIQVCNILECQGAPTSKLTYVIVSQGGEDQTSRKVIRLLKSSVLKKKNLLQVQDMPTKLRMHVKHYYVCAPRTEWIRILSGLVKSLMFPRVIVFCDDQRHGVDYISKMRDMKLLVSVNTSGHNPNMDDSRRTALQDFSAAKTQFLFTSSEPAVCQIVLPKVSCVFHLDVPSEMLSVYGVRLLPLDSQGRSDAVSVVFLEQSSPKIHDLEKLFGISFMDMPFEFIPTNA